VPRRPLSGFRGGRAGAGAAGAGSGGGRTGGGSSSDQRPTSGVSPHHAYRPVSPHDRSQPHPMHSDFWRPVGHPIAWQEGLRRARRFGGGGALLSPPPGAGDGSAGVSRSQSAVLSGAPSGGLESGLSFSPPPSSFPASVHAAGAVRGAGGRAGGAAAQSRSPPGGGSSAAVAAMSPTTVHIIQQAMAAERAGYPAYEQRPLSAAAPQLPGGAARPFDASFREGPRVGGGGGAPDAVPSLSLRGYQRYALEASTPGFPSQPLGYAAFPGAEAGLAGRPWPAAAAGMAAQQQQQQQSAASSSMHPQTLRALPYSIAAQQAFDPRRAGSPSLQQPRWGARDGGLSAAAAAGASAAARHVPSALLYGPEPQHPDSRNYGVDGPRAGPLSSRSRGAAGEGGWAADSAGAGAYALDRPFAAHDEVGGGSGYDHSRRASSAALRNAAYRAAESAASWEAASARRHDLRYGGDFDSTWRAGGGASPSAAGARNGTRGTGSSRDWERAIGGAAEYDDDDVSTLLNSTPPRGSAAWRRRDNSASRRVQQADKERPHGRAPASVERRHRPLSARSPYAQRRAEPAGRESVARARDSGPLRRPDIPAAPAASVTVPRLPLPGLGASTGPDRSGGAGRGRETASSQHSGPPELHSTRSHGSGAGAHRGDITRPMTSGDGTSTFSALPSVRSR